MHVSGMKDVGLILEFWKLHVKSSSSKMPKFKKIALKAAF